MKRLLSVVTVVFAGAVACAHKAPATEKEGTASSSALPSSAAIDERALCTAGAPHSGPDSLDRALDAARAAARKHPETPAPWLELGRLWMMKARSTEDPGFYRQIDACADVALDIVPDDTAALHIKATVLLNDHEFDKARDLAESILARDAGANVTWGLLSDALLELGDVDGAERATQRMLDLKPDLPSYGRAAYLRWIRGDRDGAKRIGREALRIGRQARNVEPFAFMLVQTAYIFWHEGDIAGATAGFELALSRSPEYSPALVGRARVAIAQRRFSDAVQLLERAYERSPSVETAALWGDAHALAGKEHEAKLAYQRAEQAGRRDPRGLALFFASKNRNHAEAVRLAERDHRDRPNLQSKDVLAWALYRSGNVARALELSKAALAQGTLEPRLLYHAGAIQIAAGAPKHGRALIRRALELNAAFDPFEALDAKRLIQNDA
jgi:tetratricopeptide (TPR) repeat protein